MPTDAQRSAAAQTMFRAANEAILGPTTHDLPVAFICECASETCLEAIELTADEYAEARADGRRFAVVPGHEDGEDTVLAQDERFTLIEKTGAAAELAAARDPRATGS